VLLTLLSGLQEINEISRIVVFCTPQAHRHFVFPKMRKVQVVEAPAVTNNPLLRFIWLQIVFKMWVRRYGCELIYNLNNLAGNTSVPQVLFIQQSLYFSREALRAQRMVAPNVAAQLKIMIEPVLMKQLYRISAARCWSIIVQTDVMKACLRDIIRIEQDKIQVIKPDLPSPVGEPQNTRTSRFETPPEVLNWIYIGNGCGYKKIDTIYRAAALGAKVGLPWRFHIVGFKNGHCSTNLPIIHYHYTDSESLLAMYRNSDGLILPSLTETVGLPLIEAFSVGTPVIVADRPYAREICGRGIQVIYFDPNSEKSLFAALCRVPPKTNETIRAITSWAGETYGQNRYSTDVWKALRSAHLAKEASYPDKRRDVDVYS
jgi:glycosyltransferase involved in cell wall biosynthesis